MHIAPSTCTMNERIAHVTTPGKSQNTNTFTNTCILRLPPQLTVFLTMKKYYMILTLLVYSVIGFAQSRYISETTKQIVFTRDGGVCQCCGSSLNLEYDHIIPYSCGGGSEVSNIQLLCQQCNRSKSNSCYCKVHNKQVGFNCCAGESTKRTSTPASQCTGTTQKGARCKNKTTNPSGRCYLHD